MSEYIAPLREMRFVLTELAGLDEISSLPGFEDATPDTVEAVLEEAGKFAAGVLAPLNRVGDVQGGQRALAYARERVQGSEVGRKDGARVAIIRHPDVRRMLMSMKCRIEAMRALAAVVAAPWTVLTCIPTLPCVCRTRPLSI